MSTEVRSSILFGHSNVLVTQRYLHPKDTLSKEAVESLVKKADNEKNLYYQLLYSIGEEER
jgi:hypothetical protein